MVLHTLLQKIHRIIPFSEVSAHCDVPCGIYDPHLAQIAAHTVIRMVGLIQEQKMPPDATSEQRQEFIHKIARYTHVKEEHAEVCKKEIRILWGDYFKPEHLEKFPELHDLVWKVMKVASKARQEINMQAAEELLQTVQKIAEIFWKTKGLTPVRMAALYPTKKDMVVPKA